MFLKLVVSICGTLGAYLLYYVLRGVYAELTSPLRLLPGPKSPHWLFGNLKELRDDIASGRDERWFEQYGRTVKLHRLFNRSQVYTIDTKAIHHILSNTPIYQKSGPARFSLGRIVGPGQLTSAFISGVINNVLGVLVVEGDVHKQQRKIMNPAFGAPQIRELTGIFVEKSVQLRDIWATQLATLDIIGLAGFNYQINALGTRSEDTPNELAAAFEALFRTETTFSLLRILQARFPIFRYIPSDKVIRESQATMMRIGGQLLADSKRDIAENGTFDTGRARDLLSLLVRANTSKEIPASQRLSDKDVLAQVPTFLIAGHETTSTAVTWALFALTQNTGAQSRLRAELQSLETENPTMDDLHNLTYLDCVVRETLRVHPPVVATSRVAMCDDVLPLATPFTDKHGIVHETLRIRKGDMAPERWLSPIANSIPGVWGQMLTFLGGPRGCIGYRFSLVEMKALLFSLVRSFEFELAVPIADIGKTSVIVQRPILLSDPKAGNQMPLLVRPAVRS
ncbi:cytochrome P450 [Mycena rosella]|uniref:Cytochrome P450 n=1 Tax=Mycena rosella TaxID=1033263 RepID=A0AAD7G5T9_MYCRO|nr:cytochrome P450 [Mycena rosella]